MPKKDLSGAVNQRFVAAYRLLSDNNNLTSLKDFCQKVGIPYSNWSKFERGERHVDLSNIINMTTAYRVSLDYLLYGQGEAFDSANKGSTQSGMGNIQQAGTGNKQKIMPGAADTGHTTSPTATEELTAKLSQCEQEKVSLARELEVTRELVRAKDDMILLLKGSRNSN